MVASVPSTPITRLFDISAAGLIAGTVPTIGTSSAARAWSRAIVEAVLQAMTTSRGLVPLDQPAEQRRDPARDLRLGVLP